MDTISDIYPRFQVIRYLTRFAGVLGAIQSVIWIGFAITGFLAYFCIIDFSNIGTNVDSAVRLALFEVYFRGTCPLDGYPNLDFSDIQDMTFLKPSNLNICLWIYLVLNALWLMSSIALIVNVDENHLRRTNALLYVWIFIALDIAALDLGLSVVFGLDYDNFTEGSPAVDIDKPNFKAVKYEAAKVASMSMLIVAIKGFILWVINVCFAIYFLTETFVINEAAISQTSLINKDIISDTHSVNVMPPITAYEANNTQQEILHARINTEAIQRANQMSLLSLKERFANRQNSDPNRFRPYAQKWEPNVPDPDYSPPVPRAKIFQGRSDPLHGNTRF